MPVNIKQFKNKKLNAFAGIGNPNNFFNLLSNMNLNSAKKNLFFLITMKFKKKQKLNKD